MSQTTKKRSRLRPSRGRADRKKKKRSAPRHRTSGLPGWGDLKAENGRDADRSPGGGFWEHVSTARFALLIGMLAAGLALYVGHVHATQQLFTELQQAQSTNQRLHLKLNRLKGEFDRRTGPSVIYERAPALGLQEGLRYGPTIHLDPESQ